MRRWVSREQSNCLVRGCWRRQNSVVTKKKYISRPHTFTLERERLIGEIDHFEAKNVDVLWAHLGRRRAHLPSRSEFRDAEGRVGCGIATSTSLCTNMGKKRSQALGAGWWQKKHISQHAVSHKFFAQKFYESMSIQSAKRSHTDSNRGIQNQNLTS